MKRTNKPPKELYIRLGDTNNTERRFAAFSNPVDLAALVHIGSEQKVAIYKFVKTATIKANVEIL